MALCAGDGAIAAVKVATLADVRDCLVNIDGVQATEEGERVDCDVEKAGVDLAKGVSREHARGMLEGCNDWEG